jgi:Glucosyl transferase GtrII
MILAMSSFLREASDAADEVKLLCTKAFVRWIAVILLVAYGPELAFPTFATDDFHELIFFGHKYYAFVLDARYLSELLRNTILGRLFPPTLLLLAGLTCLVGCGLIICNILRLRDWRPALIGCAIFAIFPFFFETFAFHSIRLFVPLAALLAVAAMATPNVIAGAGLIFLSLNLYQSALYLAIVVVIYATIERLNEEPSVQKVFVAYVGPRILSVFVGLFSYVVFIAVFVKMTGASATRLASFSTFSMAPAELLGNARHMILALIEIFSAGWFLFPLLPKLLFLALTAGLLVALATTRNFVGMGLVLVAPLAALGAAWITHPPGKMLMDRILIAFAAVYLCTFILTYQVAGRYRKAVSAIASVIVAIFVYQANIWHLYMDLRNRADIHTAELISDNILRLPEYKPNLPLIIIGKSNMDSYLPFRIFNTSRRYIQNASLTSMYAVPWSANRAISFYLPFAEPDADVVRNAEIEFKNLPVWPAPGSVVLDKGRIVIKLGGP